MGYKNRFATSTVSLQYPEGVAMQTTDSSDNSGGPPRGVFALTRLVDAVPPRLAWISDEQAAAKTGPASWSIKEELGHLIDSAANNHQRLVLVQLRDNPSLQGYDQNGWVNSHRYGSRSWQWMIESWAAINRLLLAVAESVPPGSWGRTCTIGDSGPMTLEFVVNDYVDHMAHHLRHIGVDVDAALASSQDSYPEKKARPDRPIAELIARRWSPRSFDENRPVEK